MVSLLESFPGYNNVKVEEKQRAMMDRIKELCYKCQVNPRWVRPNGATHSYCQPCTRGATKYRTREQQKALVDAGLRPPLQPRAGRPSTTLCPRCKVRDRAPRSGTTLLKNYCKECITEDVRERRQRNKENADHKQ